MKANIDETGCLEIEAETPVEAFALKQWSKEYHSADLVSAIARKEVSLLIAYSVILKDE